MGGDSATCGKRDEKLTGFWCGEVDLRPQGRERFRRRFETKRAAEGHEAYVRAGGEESSGAAKGDATGSPSTRILTATVRRSRTSISKMNTAVARLPICSRATRPGASPPTSPSRRSW
jgi:hypothetical protein